MDPPHRQSVAEISEAIGIHGITLYKWRKVWRLQGEVVPANQKDPEGWGSSDMVLVVFETAGLNTTELCAYFRERILLTCNQAEFAALPPGQLFAPGSVGAQLWENGNVSRLLADGSMGARPAGLLALIQSPEALEGYLCCELRARRTPIAGPSAASLRYRRRLGWPQSAAVIHQKLLVVLIPGLRLSLRW
ncbi:MAG: hypothetical protein WBN89_11440 [Prochlorococcaceae cyanobacterium]